MGSTPPIVVYALGGNALSSPLDPDGDGSDAVLAHVISDVLDLLESNHRVVLTHGNGPQVGHLLRLESEAVRAGLNSDLGLDIWVAATQGTIGAQLALHLDAALGSRGRPERTAVMLTRMEVNPDDPGFETPSKPVGPVLTPEEVFEYDWDVASTIHGPRRVVASPAPVRIVDFEVLQQLVKLNGVVVCGGGGGIPVIHREGYLVGVPAVIDKDRASAHIAISLEAEAIIISTGTDAVYDGFGTDLAQPIRELTIEHAREMVASGRSREAPWGRRSRLSLMPPKPVCMPSSAHQDRRWAHCGVKRGRGSSDSRSHSCSIERLDPIRVLILEHGLDLVEQVGWKSILMGRELSLDLQPVLRTEDQSRP